MRPVVEKASGETHDVQDKTWKHVVHNALEGPHSKDAHYVKSKSSIPAFLDCECGNLTSSF